MTSLWRRYEDPDMYVGEGEKNVKVAITFLFHFRE